MKGLLLALSMAAQASAQPSPVSCGDLPACGTCMAHGCEWCSSGTCASSASCGADDVAYTEGICYPGYVVSGDACELASEDGEGMTFEACAAAATFKQEYRCDFETGKMTQDSEGCEGTYNAERPLTAYQTGCTADVDASCPAQPQGAATYSCDPTTLQCVEDAYADHSLSDCSGFCGQNSIAGLAGLDWFSFPINADYESEGANVRWAWSFGEDGTVVVTNPMGVGEAALLRSSPATYGMAFTNGTAAGKTMFGATWEAPTGPATDSWIFTGAAPSAGSGSETLGSSSLQVQMYGGGTGVHVLMRDNGGASPASGTPLSGDDATVAGTWRGLSLTDTASDVFAFTFAADQASVAWKDPTSGDVTSADVTLGDVDPDTGVQSVKFGDRAGIMMTSFGTQESTRLMYLALAAAGADAPADFRAPLDAPTAGTDEWALTACLLSDPGFCDFSQSDVSLY